MSPFAFQFHIYRFRFQIALRNLFRSVRRQLPRIAPRLRAGLLWTRNLYLAPLWMSFVLSIGLWERVERRVNGRYRLRTWHRTVYCFAVSLAFGFGIALYKGTGVNQIVLALTCLFALVHFITWKHGERWLGKRLGVRPVRPANPDRAYEGLDLGN